VLGCGTKCIIKAGNLEADCIFFLALAKSVLHIHNVIMA
jgi:hypothetical protein